LYEIFGDPEGRFDRWIVKLFHNCPIFVLTALRCYLIFAISYDPALLNNLSDLLSFPIFTKMNELAASKIREYFNLNLCNPLAYLYQGLLNQPQQLCHLQHLYSCGCHTKKKKRNTFTHNMPCPLKFHKIPANSPYGAKLHEIEQYDIEEETKVGFTWNKRPEHIQVEYLLTEYEIQLKNTVSYRRYHSSPQSLADLLLPRRKLGPLVAVHTQQPATVVTEEEEEAESESESDSSSDTDSEEDEDEEEEKKYTYVSSDVCLPYVSELQFKTLHEVIENIGPVSYTRPILRIIDFYPYLGVSKMTCEYVKKLLLHYYEGTLKIQEIIRLIYHLRLIEPHCYNLLQISSDLLSQCNRKFYLMDLPYHITKRQLENCAVHNFLTNHLSFVFCSVCMQIYSHLNDPNSVYKKKLFKYGLRNASFSFLNHTLHCSRKIPIINYKGNCSHPTQKLSHLFMLGKVLIFKSKQILICPQCGYLMCFNNKKMNYMYYNQDGPFCFRCSNKVERTRSTLSLSDYLELEKKYLQQPLYCSICSDEYENSIITSPLTNGFIYPSNHFLCLKHQTAYGEEFIHNHSKIDQLCTLYKEKETNETLDEEDPVLLQEQFNKKRSKKLRARLKSFH